MLHDETASPSQSASSSSDISSTTQWWSSSSVPDTGKPLQKVQVFDPPDHVVDHPLFGPLNFYRLPHKVSPECGEILVTETPTYVSSGLSNIPGTLLESLLSLYARNPLNVLSCQSLQPNLRTI